jgi:hypothetical protein
MIFAASMPRFKAFLCDGGAKASDLTCSLLLLTSFVLPAARRSVAAAARCVLSEAKNAAWLLRWLGSSNAPAALLAAAQRRLHETASAQTGGLHLLLLDATQHSQQAYHTQNTFACGNTRPRPRKSDRHQQSVHRRSGHCFVFALLLTPGGVRIPYWLPYYTEAFCALFGRRHLSQASLAAQLVDTIVVAAQARVVVAGDTAFEAKQVRAACARRGWSWIAPLNPERRLAGRKGQRAKVRSLYTQLQVHDLARVSFRLDQTTCAAQARVSPKRSRPGTPARTYWVHHRTAAIHNIGQVTLLFSTRKDPSTPGGVVVQKVLVSNAVQASAQELLCWYALRWQIELFFKECKSGLGMCQYKLGLFARVVGWVNLSLVAFCYLEWYRRRQQDKAKGTDQSYWRSLRTTGLKERIGQQVQRADLEEVLRLAATTEGQQRLTALLEMVCKDQAAAVA